MASNRPYIVSLSEFITKGNLKVGYKSTTPVGIDIGVGRTVNDQAFLNFHTLIGVTDYEAQIVRNSAANGSFLMTNRGTGDFIIQQENSAAVKVRTNSLDRFAVADDGTLRVVNSTLAEIYFGNTLTGSGAAAISVDVANSALRVFTGGTEKLQINNVGTLVSHANANQEKVKLIGAASAGASYIGFYTDAGSTTVGYVGTAKGLNASGAATSMAIRFESILQFLGTTAEHGRFSASGTLSLGTTTSSGQLNVTSASTSRDALNIQSAPSTTATRRTMSVHHPATAGNNLLIEFLTETSATIRGSITFNRSNTRTAYNTTCDRRLKENIVDATSQGDLIDAIKVRRFNFIEGPIYTQTNFIAQELYEVYPDAVTKGSETTDLLGKRGEIWGVDASALVPVMLKEIQDIRSRERAKDVVISELNSKISTLETQMADVLARIAS